MTNKTPPNCKREAQYPTGIAEQIDENNLEKSIREVMVPKPTLTKKFKGFLNAKDFNRDGIVVSNFKEAYSYAGKTFDILVYMTLVSNIFDLEYSM